MKKFTIVVDYFIEHGYIIKLLKHSYNKSISDLLTKLFNLEIIDLTEGEILERMILCNKILMMDIIMFLKTFISDFSTYNTTNIDLLKNVYETLNLVIKNKYMLQTICSNDYKLAVDLLNTSMSILEYSFSGIGKEKEKENDIIVENVNETNSNTDNTNNNNSNNKELNGLIYFMKKEIYIFLNDMVFNLYSTPKKLIILPHYKEDSIVKSETEVKEEGINLEERLENQENEQQANQTNKVSNTDTKENTKEPTTESFEPTEPMLSLKPKTLIITPLGQSLLNHIDFLIEIFSDNTTHILYSTSQTNVYNTDVTTNKLGSHKLYSMSILIHILFYFQDIQYKELTDKINFKLFNTILEYIKMYPFNNLYQNCIVELFTILTKPNYLDFLQNKPYRKFPMLFNV